MKTDEWKVTVPEGESGGVKVGKFVVEEAEAFFFNLNSHGRPVMPGTYTRLSRGGVLWMTDTPAECREHYEPVWKAKEAGDGARVLVMGLGIGVVVQQLLRLDNVAHVDVVEIDKNVIRLVGPHYEAMGGDRLTIHHGDAYQMKWPVGTRWNVAWHDVWADICEDNLPEMSRLARSYGRRVDWQGFWARKQILRERRWYA